MTDSETRAARLLHHRKPGLVAGDPVVPPITASATYHLPQVQGAPFVYGRNGMPTWEAVEAQLALLEEAECVSFPSGMAAISAALFATLKAGDRLVIPSDGYYVTRILSEGFLAPLGVTVVQLATRDYAAADFTGVAVVYLETPSNPGLDVLDIAAVAARARAAEARVIADNTTMTPLLQRPLDLGADLVVAADTKAPAGHSDVLFGHVAGRDAALMARVSDWRRMAGVVPGPFEAFLVHRGLETLEVRLERMCASAALIADRLAAHPKVRGLRYPGLPGDPSHGAVGGQMANGGFLIGFELATEAEAEGFLARCPLVEQTTSFGGTHTAGERRARWGDAVAEGFIRLSVGVEPVAPLWTAIGEALG
ncbi:cystathionine gamma-lyase [Rhodobacter sp. SGA-6-6]|uniref:cystathionine gamma-lyase n=1 Tax=Rhodobacter sp. SGA-6-6 TaxID=2710882 RepID=UPI0013EB94F5|nr:cystathionine gamma-lyase [Rhodobacter sp. SGA-6-6]NGM46770.1 cystathionine gamma-lyase [Rhodobacter sp. SGA-6-6]